MKQVIPRTRSLTEKGNFIELVAWKIQPSILYPEGIKYSFVYVIEEKRIIAYDNFNNEGHHKHFHDKKEENVFINLEHTLNKFKQEVKEYESQ